MSGIGLWLSQRKSSAPSAAAGGDALPLIGRMRDLLREYNGDAVDLLDELTAALSGCDASALVASLRQSLSAYDFDAALATLDEIEACCGRG